MVAGLEPFIDTLVVCTLTALVILLSGMWNREPALSFIGGAPPITPYVSDSGQVDNTRWQIAPALVEVKDAAEADRQMRDDTAVFVVVDAGKNGQTGLNRHKIGGTLKQANEDQWQVVFDPIDTDTQPVLAKDGVYFSFKGATLTAKAFDRALPGLGLYIVPATAFLFAFSTIISWSYYGEQGVVFLFGRGGVFPYRIIYCLLVIVATSKFIRTENELDVISTLGTGVMLWANIPIMLLFGPMAMKAYHEYMDKLKRGEFHGHAYPKATDVIEGKDIE